MDGAGVTHLAWRRAGCLLIAAGGVLLGCAGSTADDGGAATTTGEPTTTTTATSSPRSAAIALEWTPALEDLGLKDPAETLWRTVYATSFEEDADLAGFYITPQSRLTQHAVIAGATHRMGQRAHRGWLTGETGAEPVDGPNHRGYPTIQLHQRSAGACGSPCLVDFWALLDDTPIGAGEWISLATFTSDDSDAWERVVTVNVGSEGWLHLFHVPTQGTADRAFQATAAFPRGQWVRVTTLLDLDADGGAAAVWQDGVLMSAARVEGGDGDLDQLHLGLYAAPSLTDASVWNDDVEVLTER